MYTGVNDVSGSGGSRRRRGVSGCLKIYDPATTVST